MNATTATNRTPEQLLDALAERLGFDFDLETLGEISQADPSYFSEVRQEMAKALKYWNDDRKIPACLFCGSPRVDWIEAMASWRCQDCGAVEDRTGEGRRAA